MKNIALIIVALFTAMQAWAIDGIVFTQKYTSTANAGANITVTWYVAEGKCKMKMEYADKNMNTTTYFIPDAASGAILTYTDGAVPAGQKQTYYSVPLSSIEANATAKASRVKVVNTGETKTVSGLVCEKVKVFAADNETEMWVTKDFQANFYEFYKYFRNDFALLGLNEASIKGVPLEITTKDLSGNVLVSATSVSASKQNLSEDTFKVPAGYELATPAQKK